MLENIKLIDLKYFKLLVETENFTDVYAKYSISQSTLSSAVKWIEKEINVTLIKRQKFVKGFKLKESGEELLKFIEKFDDSMKELKETIDCLNNKSVRIGIPKYESIIVINDYLDTLYTDKIQKIELKEYEKKIMDKMLELGKMDLSIKCYLENDDLLRDNNIFIKDLNVELLYNEFKRINSIDDLNGETIILLKNAAYHEDCLNLLIKKYKVKVNIIKVNSLEEIRVMVSNNLGIALSIERSIDKDANVKILNIKNEIKIKMYVEKRRDTKIEEDIIKKIFKLK